MMPTPIIIDVALASEAIGPRMLKPIVLRFVLKHQERYNSTLIEAYEFVESWIEKTYNMQAFASYEAFRQYKCRSEEMSQGMSQDSCESEPESQEVPDSLDYCTGLRIVQRDNDRTMPRVNENDKLLHDEETLFLKAVCDILNKPPKKRHWTLAKIRKECDARRKQREEEFAEEFKTKNKDGARTDEPCVNAQ